MKIMKEKYENYYELDEGTNDFIDFEVLRDAKIKAIEERLEAAQKKEGASLSTQSFEDEIDEAGSEWDEMNNNLQFAIAELVIAVAQDEARKRAASDYCAKQKLKGGGGK
jgi:DNA polymerase III delta prime subunit